MRGNQKREMFFAFQPEIVMAGQSPSKDGRLSTPFVPAIHAARLAHKARNPGSRIGVDARREAGHDDLGLQTSLETSTVFGSPDSRAPEGPFASPSEDGQWGEASRSPGVRPCNCPSIAPTSAISSSVRLAAPQPPRRYLAPGNRLFNPLSPFRLIVRGGGLVRAPKSQCRRNAIPAGLRQGDAASIIGADNG
jgi:hypothetical protein